MQLDSEAAGRLRGAFPPSALPDVDIVLNCIPAAAHEPSRDDIGPVQIGGYQVCIPQRVYLPVPSPSVLCSLTDVQQTILGCLYSRHHDGHVRESYLMQIIEAEQDWVPPFVVQLLGEYVLEIILRLNNQLQDLRKLNYLRFLNENPRFLDLTRARIVSYWNCYYRPDFPRLQDYVGLQMINELESWIDKRI